MNTAALPTACVPAHAYALVDKVGCPLVSWKWKHDERFILYRLCHEAVSETERTTIKRFAVVMSAVCQTIGYGLVDQADIDRALGTAREMGQLPGEVYVVVPDHNVLARTHRFTVVYGERWTP